jgi:hypothetical protein
MPAAELICHPTTPCPALTGIRVEARLGPAGTLELRYRLDGDPQALALPARREFGRGERLWEQGCCEAFLAADEVGGYAEYNFSWGGRWAAYGFSAYRQGMRALDPLPPPEIDLAQDAAGVALTARLLPVSPPAAGARLRLALTTVVATRDGALSYWALAHAPGRPDFHHRDGFVLELTCADGRQN